MKTKDEDRIIKKDETTNSYINKKGEHLKFTDKAMSIYNKDPREKPHYSIHINYDKDKETFKVNTKDEKGNKNSKTGNCYLTNVCMKHFQDDFDDNCYELEVLRWFRDTYVSKEDIKHYYKTAPLIVQGIELEEHSDIVYDYIYDNVIDACVKAIEKGEYKFAYSRYKSSILTFEETFAKPLLVDQLSKTLKKVKN